MRFNGCSTHGNLGGLCCCFVIGLVLNNFLRFLPFKFKCLNDVPTIQTAKMVFNIFKLSTLRQMDQSMQY